MKYEQVAKALIANKRKELFIYASFGLWTEFSQIRKLIEQDKASVVSGKFFGSWYKDETPNIFEESTFSECLEMSFNIETSLLKITMWDGDSLYGQKQTERCEWEVKVNAASIRWIKDRAVKLLYQVAQDIRDEELRKREEARVNEIMNNLLSAD